MASILGTLGTMFAVICYRNDTGLRWIHRAVSTRTPIEGPKGMEEMDFLKVDFCLKGELQPPDRQTLANAGFKSPGRGHVWPRFVSLTPGWYPWYPDESEASLLTDLLAKTERFIRLRERTGMIHQEPLEASVPIIPAGDPGTLRMEDLDWWPLVPAPAPVPEPVGLTLEEEQEFRKLPVRKGLQVEFVAELFPEASFLDEKAKRPCIARLCMAIESRSFYVLANELAHGAAPLGQAAKPVLVKCLRTVGARPELIIVESEQMEAVLSPVCVALGVRLLKKNRLHAASVAIEDLRKHFSRETPF